MGERLTRNLVSQSLLRAVAAKRPAGGLIHHSDRGSQYCAHEYRQILSHLDRQASMSRKNATASTMSPLESSWGTLKQDLVHYRDYTSRQEAIRGCWLIVLDKLYPSPKQWKCYELIASRLLVTEDIESYIHGLSANVNNRMALWSGTTGGQRIEKDTGLVWYHAVLSSHLLKCSAL
jgi:hypothetical protein